MFSLMEQEKSSLPLESMDFFILNGQDESLGQQAFLPLVGRGKNSRCLLPVQSFSLMFTRLVQDHQEAGYHHLSNR
jgi:hypothetical protein